jgi:hypothetical protein
MKRFVPSMLLFMAAVSGAAQKGWAQNYDYRVEDSIRRDRALFDKARMDLDRASAYPYASRDDIKRFDEARRDLFDFASRFDQGRYGRHELDVAIDHLDRVVNRNSLDPRDRGNLADDLRRMRDFRDFHNRRGDWRQP